MWSVTECPPPVENQPLCISELEQSLSYLAAIPIPTERLQYSSFVTYVSRQAATRHDIIMARHGRNRNLVEPVARPVPTSCSVLPRRPVWLDKSRHFVHTFCTNKLHLVATCRDGRYGRTTSGNLYTIRLRCVNILSAMSGRPDMVRQA